MKRWEIFVSIGSLSCNIYDVTDMAMICDLSIPPDIMFNDKVAVKVIIQIKHLKLQLQHCNYQVSKSIVHEINFGVI